MVLSSAGEFFPCPCESFLLLLLVDVREQDVARHARVFIQLRYFWPVPFATRDCSVRLNLCLLYFERGALCVREV